MQKLTTPNCCAAAEKHPCVFLMHEEEDIIRGRAKDTKPKWKARPSFPFDLPTEVTEAHVEVFFCPLCGKRLPDLKRVEKEPAKVRYMTDGGYYCSTCKRRGNECRCAIESQCWEPVSQLEIITAAIKGRLRSSECSPAELIRELSQQYPSIKVSQALLKLLDKDGKDHSVKMKTTGQLCLIPPPNHEPS